jgi:hypothetical protein
MDRKNMTTVSSYHQWKEEKLKKTPEAIQQCSSSWNLISNQYK